MSTRNSSFFFFLFSWLFFKTTMTTVKEKQFYSKNKLTKDSLSKKNSNFSRLLLVKSFEFLKSRNENWVWVEINCRAAVSWSKRSSKSFLFIHNLYLSLLLFNRLLRPWRELNKIFLILFGRHQMRLITIFDELQEQINVFSEDGTRTNTKLLSTNINMEISNSHAIHS